MRVYITNFNINRIISNINHNFWYGHDTFFEKQFKWLNKREISELFSYFNFFKQTESIIERFNPNAEREDVYVFESKPSYHIHSDCSLMNSTFKNFKIPENIVNQGEEKIVEYRNFFLKNRILASNDFKFFEEKVRLEFGNNCLPENVDYENSGFIGFENHSLKEVKQKIILILKETNEFMESSSKNKIIVNKYGEKAFIGRKRTPPDHNNTIFSNEEIWETLKDFEQNYKVPYKKNTIEFMRLSFNPLFEFEDEFLKKLGLSICEKCETLEN